MSVKRAATLGVLSAVLLAGGASLAFAATVDRGHLPVGQVSTAAAKNRLWSCQTSFPAGAAGAQTQGDWFNADGTWDKTRKRTVDGSVSWPSANISSSIVGDNRVISGNSLPVHATTGVFPVASTDDVYVYDRNPNHISSQILSLSIPANPTVNASPQCVGGEVGISLDGPAIFSAIDAGGRDAQAYEAQDSCGGHPQERGEYHYHGLSACADKSGQFGWALDGFAIWGPIDPSSGRELTNDDLDECHGTTSEITIDGSKVVAYHYVANDQYPYTVGCFRGSPARAASGPSPSARPAAAAASSPTTTAPVPSAPTSTTDGASAPKNPTNPTGTTASAGQANQPGQTNQPSQTVSSGQRSPGLTGQPPTAPAPPPTVPSAVTGTGATPAAGSASGTGSRPGGAANQTLACPPPIGPSASASASNAPAGGPLPATGRGTNPEPAASSGSPQLGQLPAGQPQPPACCPPPPAAAPGASPQAAPNQPSGSPLPAAAPLQAPASEGLASCPLPPLARP